MKPKCVGLIGDYSSEVTAHRVIPKALELAAQATGVPLEAVWLATDKITPDETTQFGGYSGLWCVPASPYASMAGALWAIRFAREHGVPFLGTCGGFQHALIEYARNVLGIPDADHAETHPAGASLIVSPLMCPLIEQTGAIRLKRGSLLHRACGEQIIESYHCRFGLNSAFRAPLEVSGLEFIGWDDQGEVRAIALPRHRFFVATLFQPERSALRNEAHPLLCAFAQVM